MQFDNQKNQENTQYPQWPDLVCRVWANGECVNRYKTNTKTVADQLLTTPKRVNEMIWLTGNYTYHKSTPVPPPLKSPVTFKFVYSWR